MELVQVQERKVRWQNMEFSEVNQKGFGDLKHRLGTLVICQKLWISESESFHEIKTFRPLAASAWPRQRVAGTRRKEMVLFFFF